jgi:type VI protein secretion system component VasF
MPAPQAPAQAERLGLRQAVIWTVFAALLVLGIVLWFRFAGRITPMLDAIMGR